MDVSFRAEIAVQVTDWAVHDARGRGAGSDARGGGESKGANRGHYETLSESPLLFPPKDPTSANLHECEAFSGDEMVQWSEIYNDLIRA